ncbi:TetR family transcriptional regulator [Paenibacillus oenotherae]|uniref:TetR family transcriptional regulator n=1 Tax=Paenibacillus oenotherae TaxID=1435645 RepID=A0ABS7D991_9BACL|nr:TetR family transcriptional regulator [Paenibacillus oenotherae]MBW7476426.1 TetR family transcriptional regulator [Paenibacillus oenotherae]
MTSEELDVKMRLLHAAKSLFARQGYDGTSVRQICEEAGANVALVSYHFGGKENVFQALFETFFPNKDIIEFMKVQHHPAEGIRLIVREVTNFRMREPELMRILQHEITLQSPRMDIIRKHAFPVWGELRELLRRGREDGLFRFQSLNYTFLTVLGGILFHKQTDYFAPLLDDEPLDVELFIEDTAAFILAGLRYEEQR